MSTYVTHEGLSIAPASIIDYLIILRRGDTEFIARLDRPYSRKLKGPLDSPRKGYDIWV